MKPGLATSLSIVGVLATGGAALALNSSILDTESSAKGSPAFATVVGVGTQSGIMPLGDGATPGSVAEFSAEGVADVINGSPETPLANPVVKIVESGVLDAAPTTTAPTVNSTPTTASANASASASGQDSSRVKQNQASQSVSQSTSTTSPSAAPSTTAPTITVPPGESDRHDDDGAHRRDDRLRPGPPPAPVTPTPTPTPTTNVAPPASPSTTVAGPVDKQFKIADIATITLTVNGTQLTVKEVLVTPGSAYKVTNQRTTDGGEIRITLASSTNAVEFSARLVNGQIMAAVSAPSSGNLNPPRPPRERDEDEDDDEDGEHHERERDHDDDDD